MKGFPATASSSSTSSSSSPMASFGMGPTREGALETSKAGAVHDLERNSMGSIGGGGLGERESNTNKLLMFLFASMFSGFAVVGSL